MKSRRRLELAAWCLAMLLLAGCGRSVAPTESASSSTANETPPADASSHSASSVKLDDRAIRVTGPYVHDNMAVFLIHADQQDQRDFLTLDEGLTKGLVEITEKGQGQVQELVIDNKSDKPLYLQEGERIQGGKQDRTIASSLVIPAHSGKQPLPAFCVEQSRWTEGKAGRRFASTSNVALAPKGVRGAAKYEKGQAKIWANVQGIKRSAATDFDAKNTNTSVNELFDSPRVQDIAKESAAALTAILDKHPDAVGVAIAVNGDFEEADIYPNHGLLSKLYPRLIQSYAIQASLLKDQAKKAPSLSTNDIVACLKEGPAKSRREERLDSYNLRSIRELDKDRFACTTDYDGRMVNYQVMKKNGVSAASPQQKKFNTDW